MSARVFFDSNILLYASHPSDPKGDVARSLLTAKNGVVSVQVLNEFVAVARQKLRQDWDKIEAALDLLLDLCPNPISLTFDMHLAAVEIARRYRYGIYDGMILAAASATSCSTLYSEDMHDGQTVENVTIINPFMATTSML